MPQIGSRALSPFFDSDCPSQTVGLVVPVMHIHPSGSTVKRQICDFGELEECITNTMSTWSIILLYIQT
ncbi:hypothetical protein H2201_007074 [Coniosporium apollinis]|uniref:Uncharacterized protein n=1 Tax=Coniosporium apollinis TaxID=61459 RepID=A0ABQ9NKD4_9PEZI|nr:hypothetical protein H2201_007074 [Coniosporium apollinis]